MKKPEWLKIKLKTGPELEEIKTIRKEGRLATVCEESACPNYHECWQGKKTATFMVMGDTCTRGCRFCNVKTSATPKPLDLDEPNKLADAVLLMGLKYVVITSVDRDDLDDLGANHFAKCISAIKKKIPDCKIEVLIPDFQGQEELIKIVVDAKPDVIAHNLETVFRLTPKVRDARAKYSQSLHVLKTVKKINSSIKTKSSLMVGLGETAQEIFLAMNDLRNNDCDFLTIGQYLRPSKKHIELKEYVHPTIFEKYKKEGIEKGFLYVASGPFVRSSYRAGELYYKSTIHL